MKTQINLLKRVSFPLAVFSTAFLFAQSDDGQSAPDLDGDGIPNIVDPDIDNDGLPNAVDPNVDGGIALTGPYAGKYIGDHLNNDNPAETDIDGDTQRDDSLGEIDIDGDSIPDDDDFEKDIDGDGRDDDLPSELDIDGDGRNDDDDTEDDIDGDGRDDDAMDEHDIDGDGFKDDQDDDIDGDDRLNSGDLDDDTDGDGRKNDDPNEDNSDGDNTPNRYDNDDDNDGIMDEDDFDHIPEEDEVEVESLLARQEAAPLGSEVSVQIQRMAFGDIEFEVEAEDLPLGNYDIVVDGVIRGTLSVVQDGDDTEGEIEFETFPDDPDELLLDFEVIGLPVEIKQGETVFFSGIAPTPPEGPIGGGTGVRGPVNDGLAPDSINGLSWVFSDDGSPERLDFTSDSAGQEVDLSESDIDNFIYSYQKDNDTLATLIVTFDDAKQDVYSLDFDKGTFVRQEYENGFLDDTDTGIFGSETSFILNPGTGEDDGDDDIGDDNSPVSGSPINDGISPDALTSLSITLNDGGTLERLDFMTGASGQEVDLSDLDTDEFSYAYEKTGDSEASVTISFDDQKRDEYTFDFAAGTFVRQEYDNDQLKDSDSGAFQID